MIETELAALLPTSCVTLGNFKNFFGPHFPDIEMKLLN